ncbi:hypothetical protein AB0D12_34205 [Streptomyces sp. NPDC048479]|uniref:hypothetical protein n=1 Tax=Streptomyces sp. NPDC048479 TaxID=3154725 RepID=UPI003430A7C1
MNSLAGQARTRGRAALRCGHLLTEVPHCYLPDGHRALLAQQMLNQIITRDLANMGLYAERPQNAITALGDFKALACRVINRATRQHLTGVLPDDLVELGAHLLPAELPRDAQTPSRDGGKAPSRSAVTAVSLTAAAELLAQPDVHAAGEAMRWLISIYYPTKPPSPAHVRPWGEGCSPVLNAVIIKALQPTMQRGSVLRYRTGSSLPGTSMHVTAAAGRAKRLPGLMWGRWALRMLPPKGFNVRTVQVALPCLVLQIGNTLTHPRAAKILGDASTQESNFRVLHALQNNPRWPDTQRALLRLADHLDHTPPPIDYQRRRELNYSDVLPEEDWHRFCHAAQAAVGQGPRYLVTRCYLIERISAMPVGLAPELRSQLSGFPATLTPQFVAELEATAHAFLTRCGISEPTVWEPPVKLFDGLALPGFDPAAVQARDIHELMRKQGLTAAQTADRLGTSSHVIHHILERVPLAQNLYQARLAGTKREELKRRLPRVVLAQLGRRYSEAEIARRFSVSNHMVAALRKEYGLPAPPRGNRAVLATDP